MAMLPPSNKPNLPSGNFFPGMRTPPPGVPNKPPVPSGNFFPGVRAQRPASTIKPLPSVKPIKPIGATAKIPVGKPQPKPQAAQQPVAKNVPFKKAYYKTLRKGALISFNYNFWKHDPWPLVIVSDVFDDRIRGINLHYLTFRYMKTALQNFCGKDFFSYRYIKHDQFMVNSFRTYKKAGIRQLRILDCDIINSVLKNVRSFNPQELNAIRHSIQQQLTQQLNPTAEQLAQQYQQQMLRPQSQLGFMPLVQKQDARRAFVPQTQQQMAQDLQNWQAQQPPQQNI